MTIAITVSGNGLVVEGTAQVPGESRLVSDIAPSPVGVNHSGFLVVPVVGVVLGSEVLQLPVVAVDFDTGLVEFHVLVDVSSVSTTTLHFESDSAPNIDLSVTSLGSDPVRGVLAADETLHDGPSGWKYSAMMSTSPAQAPLAPVTWREDQMWAPSSPLQWRVMWKGYFSVGFSLWPPLIQPSP